MKKNKKGFTLVEVIIAMAVFAIMSLLVCTLYAFLSGMIIQSNSMNVKVDTQVADYEKGTVDISHAGLTSTNITFSSGTSSATVPVDVYTIEGNATDSNANPNIKYFVKQP